MDEIDKIIELIERMPIGTYIPLCTIYNSEYYELVDGEIKEKGVENNGRKESQR